MKPQNKTQSSPHDILTPEFRAWLESRPATSVYDSLSPEFRTYLESRPATSVYDSLSPEFRTYLESQPQQPLDACDSDGLPIFLTPEFRAYLKSRPDFDPAAYANPQTPDDEIFAFLECRRSPRGYRGRRVAVVRGIHPRNFLIAGVTYISVLALIAFISLLIRIFNP